MHRVNGGRQHARAVMLAYVAAAGLALAGCSPGASHVAQPGTSPGTTAALGLRHARVIARLKRPGALAIGPDGRLYVADDDLNEILQLLPGGRFAVIAGNGKAGYSGDGGPAVRASLNDPGGMAFSRSGALYFADTGNNRIREVSVSGVITTVAGSGRPGGWVPGGTPALSASLQSPADVVIGPHQALYIADTGSNEIFKIAREGRLSLVAGARGSAGVWGIGRPATDASPDGPDGLAFNRAGDLFIAGSNTKTLLEITRRGVMRLPHGIDGFYPRGDGGLVAIPDGGVMAMNTEQIDRITTYGIQAIYNLPAHPRIGISGFLPDGIAMAANGTLYLDTWRGNGWTSKTALVEIRPSGIVRVLWQS
jgi:sugar lactone lactonase YvrE